jgi:hypothetical protein
MMACAVSGSMPKVGGNSAASSTPSLPLVPAPTKIRRAPVSTASATSSAPRAMRVLSRRTAASTLLLSRTITSTISSSVSVSMLPLRGFTASVARSCHLDRVDIYLTLT